jgi:S1-C subfamily serine protease
MADGREIDNVAVVGRDPFNDIAFLKINGESDLPVAQIGDSSMVEPGQQVVAIGNALGEFRNSVTTGIISGLGRPVEAANEGSTTTEKLENLFQTDAAINPGNSGGPLVNLKGEVIGINTAIAQEAEGIGFAIPLNDVKGMIKTVFEKGKIIKPYLGVRYIMLNYEIAGQLNLQVSQGAYVSGGENGEAVMADSPAAKAGLRQGDTITKVNGRELTNEKGLASSLAQFAPGEKITLTILRDGKQQDVTVTLDTYPNL